MTFGSLQVFTTTQKISQHFETFVRRESLDPFVKTAEESSGERMTLIGTDSKHILSFISLKLKNYLENRTNYFFSEGPLGVSHVEFIACHEYKL